MFCHPSTSACIRRCNSILMIKTFQNRNIKRTTWTYHPSEKCKHHPFEGQNNACTFQKTHSEQCSLHYSLNGTLSELLTCPVVNRGNENIQYAELKGGSKSMKSFNTILRTLFERNINTLYPLNKRQCLPNQAGWIRHGPPISRICRLHRHVPQRTVRDDCLSAENEARCRLHLQSNLALYEKDSGKGAAVLVSLCTVAGEPSFLFTLRSSKLRGKHKGDVSFAGGKQDPSDGSIVETALREAREELGITVMKDDVWGVLKPLNDSSGMKIAPVLAHIGPLETLMLRPNPSEVEEIFTLTVAHVCNPLNLGYTHFRTGNRFGYTLPVFHNNKYRIWGLTAVALEHTLKVIMPAGHQ